MPKVSTGMKVVGLDGVDLGRVKTLQDDRFVMNRQKGPDLVVPLDSCMEVEGTVVRLRIRANRLNSQGWTESKA